METKELSIEFNEKNFPDKLFRKYLANIYHFKEGDILTKEDLMKVTIVDIYTVKQRVFINDKFIFMNNIEDKYANIHDLTGIEYFINLQYLDCSHSKISSLNLRRFPNLKCLKCEHTNIQSLNISRNLYLETLWCYYTNIQHLNTVHNFKLKELRCFMTLLVDLDVSKNLKLEMIDCGFTNIKKLNLSNNQILTKVGCSNDMEIVMHGSQLMRNRKQVYEPNALLIFESMIEFDEFWTIGKSSNFDNL